MSIKFHPFQLYDHTGVVRWLEQQALRGRRLERLHSFSLWRFRPIAPQPLRYSVVYFPASSEFDPDITAPQEEFVELCAQGGWEYVTKQAQMMIFCSSLPDPTPIETDPIMQVETVHKAMKKNFIPAQVVLLLLAVLNLGLWGNNLAMWWGTDMIMDTLPSLCVTLLCYGLLTVMCAVHLSVYYLWRHRAKKAAAEGVFLPILGIGWFDRLCLVTVLGVLGAWLLWMWDKKDLLLVTGATAVMFVTALGMAAGVKALLKRMGVSRETNRWVTIGITFATILLGMVLVTVGMIGVLQ